MRYPDSRNFVDAVQGRLLFICYFDVEAAFLFPWATVVRELGTPALSSIIFFIVILGLGLAYAWRKGVLKWK